jgi:hypothetical protein
MKATWYNIRIMRLRFQGVPEKNDKIDLSLSNFCPDLLIAA